MNAHELVKRYGLRVEYADLGDWSPHELRSEYDPSGRTIRINRRLMDRLSPAQADAFVALALGHELYHHREHIGEVSRLPDHASREAAADAFARELLA